MHDELHAFFGFDANYSKETVKFQPPKYRNRVLFAVLRRFFFFFGSLFSDGDGVACLEGFPGFQVLFAVFVF